MHCNLESKEPGGVLILRGHAWMQDLPVSTVLQSVTISSLLTVPLALPKSPFLHSEKYLLGPILIGSSAEHQRELLQPLLHLSVRAHRRLEATR